jgi:hypothetical protein
VLRLRATFKPYASTLEQAELDHIHAELRVLDPPQRLDHLVGHRLAPQLGYD